MNEKIIVFGLVTLVIPAALYCLNVAMRSAKGLPPTTNADWLFVLFSLDFAALASPAEATKFAWQPLGAGTLNQTLVVLLLLSLVMWAYIIQRVEPVLTQRPRKLAGKAQEDHEKSVARKRATSMGAATVLSAAHIMIFFTGSLIF